MKNKTASKTITLLCLVTLLLCNGCFIFTTRDDGEILKQEVTHLKDRLNLTEANSETSRNELEEMIKRGQEQVTELEETLSRATRLLARNSADFGAEMEELKREVFSSRGILAEIRHELELLQKKVDGTEKRIVEFALSAGLDVPIDEAIVPKNEKEHLSMIQSSLNSRRFGEVRSLAKLFQTRYPNSKNMDQVQLMVCKTHVLQQQYARALGELRKFVDTYPKSQHMPEVLYEMANAFFHLGDCADARILLDTISSRYANSEFNAKAARLRSSMDVSGSKCAN